MPPEPVTDPPTPQPTLDERKAAIAKNLFSEAPPEEKKEKEPAKKQTKKAAAKVEPVKTEPEPPEQEEEDESEINYDDPVEDKNKDEDEPKVDATPEERESHAQRTAKEKGRLAKELAAQIIQKDLDHEATKQELAAERKKREEIESLKIDPRSHPDVVKISDQVWKDVRSGAAEVGVKSADLQKNFGKYLDAYAKVDSLNGDEYDMATLDLKALIVDDLGGLEVPFENLDQDDPERSKALKMAGRVIGVISRNISRVEAATVLANDLASKAQTGKLAVGVKEYQAVVKEFQPVLDAIGELPDDVIEKDPYSMSSVVARGMKENPAFKKRVEQAKKDVMELVAGSRALTQDEIEKISANGEDLKTFYAEREKSRNKKIKELFPMIVQGLVTRSMFKGAMEKSATTQNEEDDEEAEFEASRKARAPGKIKTEEKEEYVPASQRKNKTLVGMYGENYRD